MAQSDFETFLEDLFFRWDPDIDIDEGSRARTQVIEPILARLGTDPFDTDIGTFVRERIRQEFPDLAIGESDALTDTLIDPMRVLIEPIVREIQLIKLRSSLNNVDSLSDAEIDALMANFFEVRQDGGYAVGTVRIYFSSPVTISFTIANPASTRAGLRFFPTVPQQITADQMLLNIDGSEYYVDVNYTAENRGTEYNVEPGQIASVSNVPSATRVVNLRRFRGGLVRESSTEFVARVESRQSDKTLTVSRGVSSELFEHFPSLRKLQVIGYRDPEMQRDVARGGGMGPVMDPDSLGNPFNNDASFVEDGDGDNLTQRVSVPTGEFVTRVASVGSDPGQRYISLSYTDPTSGTHVVKDLRITAVLSNTQITVEEELPLGLTGVTWALRRRQLTISSLPGGISLPNDTNGELVLEDDAIHLGNKTDVYVAGPIDEETAQITSLTDESPLGRGFDARTTASSDIIELTDAPSGLAVTTGMSLVLEEGVDASPYQIREIVGTGPLQLRVSAAMSGTQSNLSWRVVDEIDVELTDPKDIKVVGADLVVAAGATAITTLGATNFIDANVQTDDIVRIEDDDIGGDYTVTAVNAVSLEVTPTPGRTKSGLAYTLFRPSEGVLPPVVRIRSLELLDSSGAPVGTTIPYREPVLAQTRGFQNESSGFVYDGLAIVGLVTQGLPSSVGVGGNNLVFDVYDGNRVYRGLQNTVTFTFTSGFKTPQQIVDELNASPLLSPDEIRATLFEYGGLSYVGISCPQTLRVRATGTANTVLGFSTDPDYPSTNAGVKAIDPSSLLDARIRSGDLVEFVEGNNSGASRVLREPDADGTPLARDTVLVGTGPVGPSGIIDGLYENSVLAPDVGVRIRVGRPSVGSARVYFLEPTSANFMYGGTRLSTTANGQTLIYRPDPELQRQVVPAVPSDVFAPTGESSSPSSTTFTDNSVNFQSLGVKEGDVLELLYRPIISTSPLAAPPATLGLSGLTLVIQVGTDSPFVTIPFPNNNFTRDDLVDFINEQLGEEIAAIDGSGNLTFTANVPVSISGSSTALGVLNLSLLSNFTNTHPDAGRYVVSTVGANTLALSDFTPQSGVSYDQSQYRIQRYIQRISSTEMNEQTDETGLYYVDVEMVSVAPGDQHNIAAGIPLDIEGVDADGYSLSTDNDVLSFSSGETLRARISRSILLVGSSDSPEEAVQLSQQNVQVNYDRSQLVSDVQAFADSTYNRTVTQDLLARHLLPHFVRVNWNYVGGDTEVEMVRAVETFLDTVDANGELEVSDLTDLLRRRGATSVFAPSSDSPTGRAAPVFVVLQHAEDRTVRGKIVTDFVNAGSRVQRFLPGSITLTRVGVGGIQT